MRPPGEHPIANPLVVLREEFDDWAVLFDPDSGDAYGLNPVGVFVWKRLDGRHTIGSILEALAEECEQIDPDADSQLESFLRSLVERGLAGYETAQSDGPRSEKEARS